VTEALDRWPPGVVPDVDALRLLGMAAHAIGDSPRSDDYLTAAEIQLRTQQRLGVLAHALSMHVIVLLELGEWDCAAAASAEAVELADETGQPIWTTGSLVCQAQAFALRGHADRALELVTRVELAAQRSRLNDLLSCALLARAIAYLTLGRNVEAFEVLYRMFQPTDPAYHQRECFGGLAFLAEAAVLARREDEAREVVNTLEATARLTPTPILHLHLGYARAVLSEPADAEANFARAYATELHRWPWLAARLDLAYGTWLCDRKRTTEADPVLAAALNVFERIGAAHWATVTRTTMQLCDRNDR
jgi:tetratricopeptide (TPR) repeat protein